MGLNRTLFCIFPIKLCFSATNGSTEAGNGQTGLESAINAFDSQERWAETAMIMQKSTSAKRIAMKTFYYLHG